MINENKLTYEYLSKLFKKDYDSIISYWEKIREYRRFYSGDTWDTTDDPTKKKLNINRISSIVNAIVGEQLSKPLAVTAIPRTTTNIEEDSRNVDILNAVVSWFRDRGNALDEEAQAYQNALISGIGYIDTYIDWEEEEDGKPVINSMDPLTIIHDCTANKTNLSDANHLWKVTFHTKEELEDIFPNKKLDDLGCNLIKSDNKEQLALINLRIKVKGKPFYKLPDGSNVDDKPTVGKYIKLYRPKVLNLFLGNDVILDKKEALTSKGNLGWRAITYEYDHHKNQYYGIVKSCMDTQMLYNRMVSQCLYNFDYYSKGGLLAEEGSFQDPIQAERDWAKPGKIIKVNTGKLNTIKIKPNQELNSSAFRLMDIANSSFTNITGVSQEFIGTREVEQAGILEKTRRQSTINVLQVYYTHLNYYRTSQFEDIVYLAKNWIPDGILIKASNTNITFNKKDIPDITYDTQLSIEPISNNAKAEILEDLSTLVPMITQLASQGVDNEVIDSMLDYTPLPTTLVSQLKTGLRKSLKPKSYSDLVNTIQTAATMMQNNVPEEAIDLTLDKSTLEEDSKAILKQTLNSLFNSKEINIESNTQGQNNGQNTNS